MFNNYKKFICIVDAIRYFILYQYGGIYADMDYYPTKYFGDINYKKTVFLNETPYVINMTEKLTFIDKSDIQNSLMMSPKNHPFWLYVVKNLPNF